MSTNFTLMKRLMSPSSTLIFPFITGDCTDPYRSKLSVTDGADDVVVVIVIIQDRVRTPATRRRYLPDLLARGGNSFGVG